MSLCRFVKILNQEQNLQKQDSSIFEESELKPYLKVLLNFMYLASLKNTSNLDAISHRAKPCIRTVVPRLVMSLTNGFRGASWSHQLNRSLFRGKSCHTKYISWLIAVAISSDDLLLIVPLIIFHFFCDCSWPLPTSIMLVIFRKT